MTTGQVRAIVAAAEQDARECFAGGRSLPRLQERYGYNAHVRHGYWMAFSQAVRAAASQIRTEGG